jgi:hypothetical protein
VLLAAMCAHGTVVITVSPASATITSGGTQQFSASATGLTKPLVVVWSASAGSITQTGLYTAPVVTSQQTATIKAARQGYQKLQYATAIVTVLPPATQHTVDLSWDVDSGAVSYSVYRAPSGGSYALQASAITGTAYTDSTVISGQTYLYAVTATDASGQESGYSNIATAVIPSP